MKVYSKTIKSQLDVLEANSGSLPDIDKLALMKARLEQFSVIELKLKKLNAALASLAVSERPMALKRLQQAQVYVEGLRPIAPQGVSSLLKIISNELISLREGIFTGNAKPKDLVLLSGLETLEKVNSIKTKLVSKIKASEDTLTEDPVEKLLIKNREQEKKLPSLSGKPFVVGRAPVSFGLQSKNYTGIGDLDTAKLSHSGFKVDTLYGYSVMHNQLVIGVSKLALEDTPKIKVKVNKFKDGKPVTVVKRREATYLDVVNNLKKQIENQTKQKYTLVSDLSYGYQGGSWFWLMPTVDADRFAKAFPGGHLKLPRWGFAF